MKGFKRILSAAVLLGVMLGITGCGVKKFGEIEITSVKVKSVVPVSTRSLEGILLLGVSNPAPSFTINDLEAQVKISGNPIGVISASQIHLDGRTEQVYEIPCTATLAEGASLLSLTPLLRRDPFNGMTADVTLYFNPTKKGKGAKLVFKDLDIAKLAE